MHSPAVLAGHGFGVLASHGLTMAAHLSSASDISRTLESLTKYD